MSCPLPDRLIAHLDMDAFYASVELLRYPQLRGWPVVVGGSRHAGGPPDAADAARPPESFARLGNYSGRGVVTTATYEARAYGVHSGLGLMKAARLAPDALLLPADFERYRHYSRLFKTAVAELAPTIEDRGIDEIYIDLSALPRAREAVGFDAYGGVRALAQDIKNNVRRRCGLSCSIGIAPNKLLAKIGSELQKPDGLTVLAPEDLVTRIWPLPVRAIKGIGPKAGARLTALGITRIGELAGCELLWLQEQFGRAYGRWLFESAQGRDERPVELDSEPVSVSRETTFERDLHARLDRALLSQQLISLCERVAADLARKQVTGRTIGIKLRFDDFRTVTRDLTLPAAIGAPEQILAAARQCLRRVQFSRRLRLLGVRVGSLQPLAGSAADAPAKARRGHTTSAQARAASGARSAPAQDGETLPLFGDGADSSRPA
jgi:DNA polymerase-4